MPSRAKIALAALVVSTSLSLTVTVGSASASWFVGGSQLTTSAALATLAGPNEHLEIHIFNPLVLILCSGPIHFLGAELLPGNVIDIDLLSLACSTTSPASGCSLAGTGGLESIQTVPLVGVAALGTSPADRITLKPATKTTIATIAFSEANTCAFNAEVPLKGSFTIAAPKGQTEETQQTLSGLGSLENNSLEAGAGSKAGILGSVLVLLASHSKWSFR